MNLQAWQRPTLAGGSPQLPSALKSLTTVFGMGTGVTSSLSPPDLFVIYSRTIFIITHFINELQAFFQKNELLLVRSKLDKTIH